MNNRYIIALWLITIILAPFMYGLYEMLMGDQNQANILIKAFPITILFSIIFSSPTL